MPKEKLYGDDRCCDQYQSLQVSTDIASNFANLLIWLLQIFRFYVNTIIPLANLSPLPY
jgi:hypothetical protein